MLNTSARPHRRDRLRPEERTPAGPCVAGTSRVLPDHRYEQAELARLARELLPALHMDDALLARFFQRVGVSQRYLALPGESYAALDGFGARNDAWIAAALPLAERAVKAALKDAGLAPEHVDLLMTTTITGLAVPSLDARLMNRMEFRRDTKRVPLFGLGCLAGAAGLARASEYLRAYPDQVAVLLAVELCSLTVQTDDVSVANLISTGLFGDGAAAVVLVGADHPLAQKARPEVVDSRAQFFPHTERVMGWDVVDGGFRIVLDADVPKLAEAHVPVLVDALLTQQKLTRDHVKAWVAHPGGPAVIAAMTRGLGLDEAALDPTRQTLRDVGNLSSASVLFLLDEHRRARKPASGQYGVMLAMGPAFSAEAVLLRW